MSESRLRELTDTAFREALRAVSGNSVLAALERELWRAHRRLDEPMTVALVGRIKAGKSTMANALLGAELAPTASTVCTYNVNVFVPGPIPSLTVHYRDARAPVSRSIDDLEALTRQDEHDRRDLTGIDHLEIRHPAKLLRTFRLVDTPGLLSPKVVDSDNALRVLGTTREEVNQRTETEARLADAVLYLFSRSLGAPDTAVVAEFTGPAFGQASPINAIGVFSKVDNNYKDVVDPIAKAREIGERLLGESPAAQLFYRIVPVCGLLALGARMLSDDEYAALRALAAVPQDELRRLVERPRRFVRTELAGTGSEHRRMLIENRLGQYGILLACDAIRNDRTDLSELRETLLERSGMRELEALIRSHFGNRAFVIKLERVLRDIRTLCLRAQRHDLDAADAEVVAEIDALFEEVELEAGALAELRVLRRSYQGALSFDEREQRELLRITGEYGTGVCERLADGPSATPEELAGSAGRRIRYWRMRASDIAAEAKTQDAAQVMVRSYERLLAEITAAAPTRLTTQDRS